MAWRDLSIRNGTFRYSSNLNAFEGAFYGDDH